jgi:hypothetical protein
MMDHYMPRHYQTTDDTQIRDMMDHRTNAGDVKGKHKKAVVKRTVKYLSVCRSPTAYRNVAKSASDDVIRAICNAAKNVEQGDVHLTPAERRLFSAHRKKIAKLTADDGDVRGKRKVIESQKAVSHSYPFSLALRWAHSAANYSVVRRHVVQQVVSCRVT